MPMIACSSCLRGALDSAARLARRDVMVQPVDLKELPVDLLPYPSRPSEPNSTAIPIHS